jgi:hypothetical protein
VGEAVCHDPCWLVGAQPPVSLSPVSVQERKEGRGGEGSRCGYWSHCREQPSLMSVGRSSSCCGGWFVLGW